MQNLKEYMQKVGITKKKYVKDWLDAEAIPGVILAKKWEDSLFPDSARRPYRSGSLKATSSADSVRTHIVKACLEKQHITYKTCFMSKGEFDVIIQELQKANLLQTRIEDDIIYLDSTMLSASYLNKPFKDLRQFVLDIVCRAEEGRAKGVTVAVLER